MIIVVFVLALASVVLRVLPPLLAELVATIEAVFQAMSANRIRHALSDRGSQLEGSDSNRTPTAADRRLLKRALRASMRRTQTASLFPHIAHRGEIISVTMSRSAK